MAEQLDEVACKNLLLDIIESVAITMKASPSTKANRVISILYVTHAQFEHKDRICRDLKSLTSF